VAYRECSWATGRRGEAMKVAGHVRRRGGCGSPEKRKEASVLVLQTRWASASEPKRCAGVRRMG
jgi:hypothetical protein